MKNLSGKPADITPIRPGIEVRVPAAPAHLSRSAKVWWRKIAVEYEISDDAGLLLLATALEAFDRMKSASARVKKDGQTFRDRFGQIKVHPLIAVERDGRAAMLAALKALNLDIEPLRDAPGRPLGSFPRRTT